MSKENYFIIRPFGPSIVKLKMPQDLINNLNSYVDEIITRTVDIWAGLPYVLIALVVVGAIGPSLRTMVVLLVLVAWSPFVRQVRGEVLVLKDMEYVSAAKIAGASSYRILFFQVL